MYYNPFNNRAFFYFSKNSYYSFSSKSSRPDHITTELREKWEHDVNVVRLASDILGDWDAL